ncbi:extracellular solute-binding protein [Chitinimonas sp. BJB300]|uniref:extracellular solute-binding protein n=1 Tax=Chitinimonas sp. BJB300 TaxID=1559339 RepID=UPI000C11E2BB|nr:extracellular solute-binding protein [Chitinimonas sp. BJB300]PHV11563.1 spermidine/putrescine ABC transporter substrate-binding protein PotF [Chitinimonas sp. BJB300]TSJ88979.1 extracellular solute-binding protein [Chitinimonas sp. BJB300]
MAQFRIKPTLLGTVIALSSVVAAHAAGTVNVYNYNDYIAPDTIANFEKASGLKVKYDLFESVETLQSKLLTGKSGYDVVYPSADYAGKWIQAQIFQPIDKTKLPNLGNLNPEFLKKLETVDPGNKFLVPYMWGTMAFGINVDKVKKALGSEPMPADQWELVFNPKYTSKLKSCGISFITMTKNLFAMANIYNGKPANDFSKANVAASLETLKAVRKDVRVFNDSPIDLLANGDVCVAMAYNGDVYIARDRAAAAKKPQNVEYMVPAKGTIMWLDVMAIPKDSKNADNAHKWINNILDPKVVAAISNTVSYANPNAKATSLVDKKISSDTKIYPAAEALQKLQPLAVIDQPTQMTLTKAFNQFKTAK